jgi:hypothetical protein
MGCKGQRLTTPCRNRLFSEVYKIEQPLKPAGTYSVLVLNRDGGHGLVAGGTRRSSPHDRSYIVVYASPKGRTRVSTALLFNHHLLSASLSSSI